MNRKPFRRLLGVISVVVLLLTLVAVAALAEPETSLGASAQAPPPPATAMKLVFVHHSCGENWLADDDGGLGLALRDNNYFVSDTNYGWGPDGIGDNTDIGHWWTWFLGPERNRYTAALYTEYGQNSAYSRRNQEPGGENEIVMFKSCYPQLAALKEAPRPRPRPEPTRCAGRTPARRT